MTDKCCFVRKQHKKLLLTLLAAKIIRQIVLDFESRIREAPDQEQQLISIIILIIIIIFVRLPKWSNKND